MFRAMATVGGWTMLSRILGFARDILIAAKLGAGPMADAFFVALKLPNLFRRLFGEGAFNAAFVPAFATALTRQGPAVARQLAERLATLMALWLALLCGLGLVFMPQLLTVLAPGFPARGGGQMPLAVELTRIVFPYLVFICLTALVSGVLNAMGRFTAAAAAPVFFNILSMAALVGLAPFVATPAHALAWGVMASGAVQLGLVWWAAARAGMALRPVLPRLSPAEKAVLRKMVPGLLGAGVTQLNLAVDVIIASLLPVGAVSLLYYADRVAQLPLGVIGIAISTALLPTLAAQLSSGKALSAHRSMNRGLEITPALCVPAAVALAVLAQPIMSVLFQRGAFTAADARGAAWVLMVYAAGLPAFVLVKALAPGFFARGDTRTPVIIGLACVALNLALNLLFLFTGWLGAPGIALATVVAAWVNALAMGLLLSQRGLWVADRRLRRVVPRQLGAAAAMGGLLAALVSYLPMSAGLPGTALLGLVCTLGAATYFGLAQLSGALDLRALRRMMRPAP
jgi:putative peptidoglycan lipid II flippase